MCVVIYAGQICNQCANNFIDINNNNSNKNTSKNVIHDDDKVNK